MYPSRRKLQRWVNCHPRKPRERRSVRKITQLDFRGWLTVYPPNMCHFLLLWTRILHVFVHNTNRSHFLEELKKLNGTVAKDEVHFKYGVCTKTFKVCGDNRSNNGKVKKFKSGEWRSLQQPYQDLSCRVGHHY